MANAEEDSVIHPEDGSEVLYWTKKWGVTHRQIYDAILETGSVKLIDIKKRLRSKGEIHGWMYRFAKLL
jgi:hypothetical protein